VPALACIDDLAGVPCSMPAKDPVRSADLDAAAVAYAAAKITRLTSFGDIALRSKYHARTAGAAPCGRARRYGLMAYCWRRARPFTASAWWGVPLARDSRQIATNLDERLYENLVPAMSLRCAGTDADGSRPEHGACLAAHRQTNQCGILTSA
jgi:hypothetical protein